MAEPAPICTLALISRVRSKSTVAFRESTLAVLNGQKGLRSTAESVTGVPMLAGRSGISLFDDNQPGTPLAGTPLAGLNGIADSPGHWAQQDSDSCDRPV